MKLSGLSSRAAIPEPWAEGDNIPWKDPSFSQRMLEEHLNQEHDAASRRFEKIDRQVDWIHNKILSGQPTRILDIACGPGLYTNRLAKLGHECAGIDYLPASIAYARDIAEKGDLRCAYLQEDIRTAEYGTGFGLAMLIFGEFNVFKPDEVKNILRKANFALNDNGILLLEPQTYETVKETGEGNASWYYSSKELFSENPHLCLQENFWDPDRKVATTRFFIVDASTTETTQYAVSYQAYAKNQYYSIIEECGFRNIEFYPTLIGIEDESQTDLIAIVARRGVFYERV